MSEKVIFRRIPEDNNNLGLEYFAIQVQKQITR